MLLSGCDRVVFLYDSSSSAQVKIDSHFSVQGLVRESTINPRRGRNRIRRRIRIAGTIRSKRANRPLTIFSWTAWSECWSIWVVRTVAWTESAGPRPTSVAPRVRPSWPSCTVRVPGSSRDSCERWCENNRCRKSWTFFTRTSDTASTRVRCCRRSVSEIKHNAAAHKKMIEINYFNFLLNVLI